MLATLASAACQGTEDEATADSVLARVGSETISVADFERELAERARRAPGRYSEPSAREQLLRDMIAFRAEVAAARARGLDETPEFILDSERMLVRRLRAQELEAQLAAVSIDEAAVQATYEADPARFTQPERFRAAIVEVAVPSRAAAEVRASARARAEALLEEARALGPGYRGFGPIAARHSDDRRSRYKGGDIGWLDRGKGDTQRVDAAVARALFELEEPGEIGPVIETPTAFYLLMLLERAPETLLPLARVAPVLRAELLEAERRALEASWHADIASEMTVETDAAALASIGPPSEAPLAKAPPRPPALPQ